MRNLFLIFLSLSLFTSCVEVSYEEAQPQKTATLKTFPKALQGQYCMSYKDTLNENDTLIITENYFTKLLITSEGDVKRPSEKMYLSDSLVLKQLDHNYVLNFREKETWIALVIQPIENYGYSILWIDGDNEASVKNMNSITKGKVIKDEEGKIKKYILKPKKKVFMKLLNKEAVFTELCKLKKL